MKLVTYQGCTCGDYEEGCVRCSLREELKDIEEHLDNLNGERGDLCLYCNAENYDGKVGIIHEPKCIIVKLRHIIASSVQIAKEEKE